MKKIVSLLLALALPIGLTSCGATSVPVASTEAVSQENAESAETEK